RETGHYPARSGTHLWPDRRPHLSRRARARSARPRAPAARMGPIHHADSKSVSLRVRNASGNRSRRTIRRTRSARTHLELEVSKKAREADLKVRTTPESRNQSVSRRFRSNIRVLDLVHD